MKRKSCGWLLIVLLLILTCMNPIASAQEGKHGEILVLHSYSPDYDWTQTEQEGIDSVFKPLRDQYKVRIEYIDSGHSPGLLNGPLLVELYKEKFSNSHFQVIIVTDNAALDFMRQYRDQLFPGVPVVFCGINGYNDSMIQGMSNVTGVAEHNDFLGLFDIALKLHRNTKRIVIYGNPDDPSHIANTTAIKNLLPQFQSNVKIEIREFPHIEACIADAQTLPADSIVMMVGSMRSASGEGINLQQANEIMSVSVKVPVYTAWDFGLNHGAIGGLVVSGTDQGRLAAEMTLRILNGEAVQTIPVVQHIPNVYMFDYNQLVRFGLRPNQLPKDAVVFNSPDRTYRINREIFWAGAFSLALLAITVLILTISIQRRKQAEAALAASEEKFSKAFRYCADVVGIARLEDGCYIEVSDAFFETFGYTREEVIGKISTAFGQTSAADTAFSLWHSVEARNELFDKFKKEGFFKNLETYWCTKSGEVRIGLYSAEVVSINDEPCIIYVWHDITERKRAEEALRQAHHELEGKVEQRTQELSSLNQELIAMNEELQAINDELQHENAERRRVEQQLATTNEELTKAIEELKAMQTYLVQSEKMAALGSLVAGVAHEINTPLGVGLTAASHLKQLTRQFLDLCQNGAPRRQDLIEYLEDLEEASTIILKNLERGAKLIQSFKQVSVDQSSEQRRIFNVKKYLNEILLSMQPQLKKNNHSIAVHCSDKLEIDGYPGAFAQIITNLVMNSLTHAFDQSDAGNIDITVEENDNHILLTYADDGKGMDYTVLNRIFDPFFTTKRGTGGTGLGLYIVYNIVTQQFDGTIECDSEPDQGTSFRIRLPLRKEAL